MARFASVLGLLALVSVPVVAVSVPARAEFWGCNSKNNRGRVLYSYTGWPDSYSSRYGHTRAPGWSAHWRVSHSRAYYGYGRYGYGRLP
jgi:hypothetical protein